MFENKCPLNSFSFLSFVIIKSVKPKSNIPSVTIVYHCILQVHSIDHTVSCDVTTPIFFICCKARLVTKVLSFMCSQSIEITNIVTCNKIIAVTNRKTFNKLLKKKFLQAILILYKYAYLANENFCFLLNLMNKVLYCLTCC